MIAPRSIFHLAILLSASPLLGQNNPAASKNAVRNGGFERTLQAPNVWVGVNREGLLTGQRLSLPVLTASGEINPQAMPISVSLGDLNGDGNLDIMAGDAVGQIRIYFNQGSKQDPKFSPGEMTPPFLALSETPPPWKPPGVEYGQAWEDRRRGIRLSLADSSNTGKLDLVVGNYFGEIFFIPNRGSGNVPRYEQPAPLSKGIVPTMKDPNHRWGNLFAPLYFDWDGDRRPDLIVGEGSYSANNIHLLLNQGGSASPRFDEEKRQVLALGEGRQQLVPTLADVNGDGLLDILAADSTGSVTAYLRPATWKTGDSMKPSGYLAKNGGLTDNQADAFSLGSAGIHTISAGDLNGDNLFDLVIGRPSGVIAWSANKGTKDKPKLDPPVELKAEKAPQAAFSAPSGWEIDLGAERGNAYVFADSVNVESDPGAQPREGTRALKFGFYQPSKSVLPIITQVFTPPADPRRPAAKPDTSKPPPTGISTITAQAPSNLIVMRQAINLDVGKTYNFTMQIKGSKVRNAVARIVWTKSKETGEAREVRGERGAVKRVVDSIRDFGTVSLDLRPGANWTTASTKFKVEFPKEKALNEEKETEATLLITFELQPTDGVIYFDDIQLVPSA